MNDKEFFPNFKLFHVEKKYWKYLIFDTEYSHISNNKSGKVSLSFGSPYWNKKLENIIFQLSITYFSEQFKIVKNKFLIDDQVKTPIRIIWMSDFCLKLLNLLQGAIAKLTSTEVMLIQAASFVTTRWIALFYCDSWRYIRPLCNQNEVALLKGTPAWDRPSTIVEDKTHRSWSTKGPKIESSRNKCVWSNETFESNYYFVMFLTENS